MEKDLAEGNIGSGGKYSLKLEGSKLQVEAGYGEGAVSGSVALSLDIKEVLILLKDKIPSKIDDVIIDFIIDELDRSAEAPKA